MTSNVLLAGVALLCGCSAGGKVDYARDYPRVAQAGPTLDIQVFRTAKHIELTNTTARKIGPSTIWLNSWYSRPIPGLGVGETVRLALADFRDVNSEAFRGGGFFAAERPDRLVRAELETVGDGGRPTRFGLVVVGGNAE